MPMPCMVLPNPAARPSATWVSGSPASIPMISPPISRDKNGCRLNLIMDTSTKTSDTANTINNRPNPIDFPPPYVLRYSLKKLMYFLTISFT